MSAYSLSSRPCEGQPGNKKNQEAASLAENNVVDKVKNILGSTVEFSHLEIYEQHKKKNKNKYNSKKMWEVNGNLHRAHGRIKYGITYTNKPSYVVSDFVIRNTTNGKRMFFEVKNQGRKGNAHERACKHHTPMFRKNTNQLINMSESYIPVRTIFCGLMTTIDKYSSELFFGYEPEAYFLLNDEKIDEFEGWLKTILKEIST